MKKLFLFLLLSLPGLLSLAQNGPTTDPPYKRYPTTPPLKLLLPDSTSHFTKDDLDKKKAVVIMLFSPECDHCKHETEDIIKHIDEFKKVQIIMATTFPFGMMKSFYEHYDLQRFHNIVMGTEVSYFLPTFYNLRNFPFLALYDKKGHLIGGFEGSLPVEKILEKLKEGAPPVTKNQ